MPAPEPPRARSLHFAAILGVARKELTASLRDRQTAIYTFVLPICMYPILFWVMVQGALLVQGRREHTDVRVGVAAARPEAVPEGLERALEAPPGEARRQDARDADERDPPTAPAVVERLPGPLDAEGAHAWLKGGDRDPTGADAERPDAVLFLATPTADEARADPEAARARLFFDSTNGRSSLARRRVGRRLPAFAETLRSQAALAAGLDPRELDPLEVRARDVAPKRDKGALALSLVLPMLLVIMAVMGAFFPAVDLTAGEKERGTAETTLLLPVPRAAVHQGKILAVCATAVVATSLNLLAIGLSAEHLLGMLAKSTPIAIELPVLALVSIAPLALLFAFFVSALLTSVAGLAASFKEGQALLGPVQMVFIVPALVGAVPGIQLNAGLAFVPVVNVVLAFRAMLLGRALYLEYALVALALLVYAWIAIAVAVRLLSRESLLLSSRTIPLRRLLATLRTRGATH